MFAAGSSTCPPRLPRCWAYARKVLRGSGLRCLPLIRTHNEAAASAAAGAAVRRDQVIHPTTGGLGAWGPELSARWFLDSCRRERRSNRVLHLEPVPLRSR